MPGRRVEQSSLDLNVDGDCDRCQSAPVLIGETRFPPSTEIKNILVTGGAGFIASWLVRHLTITYHDSYNIICLDKLNYCASLNNLRCLFKMKNFTFVKGDITSSEDVRSCLLAHRIDTIIHFAAESHVDTSFGNSHTFTHNNVIGTHVLLEAAKEAKISRFIHTSTDEVYGETDEKDGDVLEEKRLAPTNPYSASKAAAEMYVNAYWKSYRLPAIIVRINNVYGPHQYPEKIIPKFATLLGRGQKLPLHGDGSHSRKYVYAGDVVNAFDIILHKGEVHQIYNVDSPDEMSNWEICSRVFDNCKLARIMDGKLEDWVERVQDRPFNDKRYNIDGSKLRRLGWTPKMTFEKGLPLTVNWYLQYGEIWWVDVSPALTSFPVLKGQELVKDGVEAQKMDLLDPGFDRRSLAMVEPEDTAAGEEECLPGDDRRFLVWGGRSWVAGHLHDLLQSQGKMVKMTTVRMEDRLAVRRELESIQPTHVFNCAGVTGRPNVDWCEDHRQETLTSNLSGTINLAVCCAEAEIHLTIFATGCIYTYDKNHPEGGPGYLETDAANFEGSFYSLTKAVAENYLKQIPCLVLRLRMPVSDDLHPRSFVTKITNYEYVVNIENSNSILHDLLPAAVLLAEHNDVGVYNFTNPGAISHNEVLTLFRDIVRPGFKWKNFTEEQQSKILKAGRSNCKLDTGKLIRKMEEYRYTIPEVHEAYEACFRRMAANNADGRSDGSGSSRAWVKEM